MTIGMEIAGIRMKRTSFPLLSGGSTENKILLLRPSYTLWKQFHFLGNCVGAVITFHMY